MIIIEIKCLAEYKLVLRLKVWKKLDPMLNQFEKSDKFV
jgi:hypothetical protein